MNSEQVQSLIRAILSAIGGYFVGKGIIDASTMTSIVGALATLGVAVWGFFSKTNNAIVASAAALPEVQSIKLESTAPSSMAAPVNVSK